MTKIFYITYDDISIKCDSHGIFQFDTSKIFTNIARRYFTMPDWILPDVEKVFDNSALIKAKDREDIRKIINQKLVEINNLVVPVARLNKLINSGIPDWMKLPRYANERDIKVSIIPRHNGSTFTKLDFKVDFTTLVDRVCRENELMDVDARAELINEITDLIKSENSNMDINPFNQNEVEDQMQLYCTLILRLVNKFITKYAEPSIVSDMKDTVGLNPYFAYDLESRKVTYSEERVLHLLDAMDYAAVDNPQEYEDYITTLCSEIEEEMEVALETITPDMEDEYLEQNITLSVNLSILNRMLFVKNNNIDLDEAVGLIYPDVSASQLDIEMFYVDACTEMMTYDIVLDDLSSDLDVPKSDLRDDVEELIAEVNGTYRILRDNKETLDVIYKGVRHAYFDMYDRLYDKYAVKGGGTYTKYSPSGNNFTTNYFRNNKLV